MLLCMSLPYQEDVGGLEIVERTMPDANNTDGERGG
jgi:hypothetical protein